MHFDGFAVQQVDAGLGEDFLNLSDCVTVVVVISEDADDRNLDAVDQLARELRRFLWQAVISEVARQDQNVGFQT